MARGSRRMLQRPPPHMPTLRRLFAKVLALLCAVAGGLQAQAQTAVADLPLEQLMQMQVTTASR